MVTKRKLLEYGKVYLEKSSQIMAKSIYKQQNNKDILLALATQRKLYKSAKGYNIVALIIVVANVSLATLMLRYSDNALVIAMLNLVVILGIYLTVYINNSVAQKISHSAQIQQYIDGRLYSTVIGGNLSDWNVTIRKSDIAEFGENISINDIESVKNWYKDYSDLDAPHQIFCCQKENISWDGKIRNMYKWFVGILFVVGLIIVLCCSYAMKKSLATQICIFACFIPLINYYISSMNSLNNDISRLKEIKARCSVIERMLDDSICLPEEIRLLIELQSKIFEHRGDAFLIPECFFKLFKNELNKRAGNNANNIRCLNSGTNNK